MKKLITFSVYLFGISIVLMAASLPNDWVNTVDDLYDGLLFQTNTASETNSDLAEVQAWLNITNETPEGIYGVNSVCIDDAGTVTRALGTGGAAGVIEPLCWGNDYIITHDGNAIFTGDGDPLTQAGVDLMIFTDVPTISGPLVSDIAMNTGYTGNVVGTDPLGNITLTNLGVYQNFYGTNAQGYTELWFAPVTLDDVTSVPKTLSEDVGGANECVNINTNAAFQIVFLDSIHIDNFITPTGGNLCQASFTVSGGLMAYNGMNYTVSVEEVSDPTITGTFTLNPNPAHNSTCAFTVPQAGFYNLNVSDGCTTKTMVVDMSACVSCTDDAGTLTTSVSPGSNSTNPLYLCFGDTLSLAHNGDQDVAGDPDPATTPGVQYALYTCLPTITGPTLNAILGDPCLITNSSGAVPQLASNIDGSGNGFLSNANGLYQGYLTSQFLSPTDTLFFAPITVDAFPPATWEGVTGPNECTNVNINAAFPVVFLSQLVIQTVNNQSGGNVCRGDVTTIGGLPEADGSNYIITVELMSNPSITGTIITPASQGGTAVFEVPQPGNYQINVTDANGCTTSQAFVGMSSCTTPCANFQLTGGISSDYNGADISCSGSTDGSIEIIPTGGSYPFTYAWSHDGALTDSVATALASGSYTVTVTDTDGCTHDTTITLTSPSPLFVGVIGANPLCSGDATGIVWVGNIGGGTQPYTFTWSNGASGNDTIFNLLAGNYALTLTDANGCSAQASTTLGDPPVLNGNFTTVNDATCEGVSDGDATISATGGTSPYAFTWAHDAALITANATNLAVGRYFVTITDDHLCTYIDSVDIAATLVVSATSAVTDVNCFDGNDGEILVTPLTSGGAPNLPYNFSWSPNTAELTNNATGLTIGNYIYTVTDNVGCLYIDSAIVNQPDSITITNISTTNVLCNGATDGEITVSASGGAVSYTYDWGNGNTDSTLSNVAAGTYTVTVTDANTCTNTLTITLAQPPAIVTNPSSTNVSCNSFTDGTATVAPTGGSGTFGYTWSTDPTVDTLASVTGLAAGQYYITITDSSSCSIIDTVDITQPAALIANTNATDQSCFNIADGTATATPTGGTAPYTFLWSNASVNDTLTGLTAATYFVTVTDANGCNMVDNAVVGAPPAITATTSTTPVSCQDGTNGTATATAAGGSGSFTYLWNNNQIGQTASSLGAGNYDVTITDGSGCTLVETVSIVELPPLNPAGGIIANPVSCFGGNDGSIDILGMTGGTAPYAYTWSTTPTQDSSVAIDLAAGIYSVIITDANGCTFGPVNVTVNQPAAAVAGTMTTIDPSCNGEANGSITVDATGGTPSYTYLWNNGQTTQTASDLPIGTYDVTITDASGCTSTASGTLIQPDPLTAQVSALPTSCNGTRDGRIVLDNAFGGSEPYAYSIDAVNYQPIDIIFFGLSGGNYDVYVQDGNGCIIEQQVNVNEPPLIVVDLGVDVELELGDNLMLEAIVNTTDSLTYVWGSSPDDPSISCTDCATPVIAPIRSTTYTVTVQDTSGCTATDDIYVKLDKNRNVFIPNAFTPNGDGRNDEFMVFAGTGVVNIKNFMIYDRWGNQLYVQTDIQPNDPSVGWDGRFRGDLMDSGVYVFYIAIEFSDGLVFPYKGDITLIR